MCEHVNNNDNHNHRNNRHNHHQSYLSLKKWILFTCAILVILNAIMISIFTWIYIYPRHEVEYDSSYISRALVYFTAMSAMIIVAINTMGAIGIYKQHFCLTLTYASLMAIVTVFSIYLAFITFNTAANICSLMFVIIISAITVLAFVFANDLYRVRYEALSTDDLSRPNRVNHNGYVIRA